MMPHTDRYHGLVIEMTAPGFFHQLVLVATGPSTGVALERMTSEARKRRHWRAAHYRISKADGVLPLDVTDRRTWLGSWLHSAESRGFTILGKPFLLQLNGAEMAEVADGRMPRSAVLRINKSRSEIGYDAPWKE